MTPEERDWLLRWCGDNGLVLELSGEVGFGRDCVGISDPKTYGYVDYDLHEGDPYDIETPLVKRPDADKLGPGSDAPDAYHKHDCLAVLGLGEAAEDQLYKWVRRLVDGGAVIQRDLPLSGLSVSVLFLGVRTRTRITFNP